MYLKEGPYELNTELKEDAINVFDASFEKLNFDDGPGSADTINKWVIHVNCNKVLSFTRNNNNAYIIILKLLSAVQILYYLGIQ